MRLPSMFRLRLRSLFARATVERELDEELRYHVERQIEENVAHGMNRGEARRAAMRSIEGLELLLKEYEKEQMEKEVYGLIPEAWHGEMRMFTEDEFSNIVTVGGRQIKASSSEISEKYNSDEFNPRDGELLKATDELAAFIEAFLALQNGLASHDLQEAKNRLKERYKQKVIAGINFGELYAEFE